MTPRPLQAHSLAEIQLYLMATPCDACRRGPLQRCDPWAPLEAAEFTLTARCAACGQERELTFALPADRPPDDPGALYPIVNPTDEPSCILDVGQWIVLFRVILAAAAKEKDKIEARRLGYEAAQCLEEAIRFYGAEDELPGDDAIFTDATRDRRRDHPELFAKRHLVEMRAKLPKTNAMQRQLTQGDLPAPGKWWQFWRR